MRQSWIRQCGLILIILGFTTGGALAGDEIVLGSAISQTGKYAREGKFYVDAYTITVDAINKAGGVKVGGKPYKLVLKLYDDQSDPNLSVRLFTRLVTSDKVNFLLGPYSSGITIPASTVAEKYEIPMVQGGGASGKIFDRGYKYIFGTGWSSEAIVAEGITQVPEGRRLFPQMTVRENLLMGAYRRRGPRGIERAIEAMYELFPVLKDRQRQRAGSMSGGEQQMCAIGRGLMARPRILILDELSLGLALIMRDVLVDALQRVHAEGTTVFVAEQDVATAFDLATTGYVLENGRVVLSGPTADLRSNPLVKRAYLGL